MQKNPWLEKGYSQEPQQQEISAILGPGTEFEGRFVFEGIVRIDGRFSGDIFSRDTLIIGPDAVVVAQIDADVVIVAGRLEGQIKATSRVEIQPTGNVRGRICAPIFKIEEGGVFDGSTQMLPESEPR